MTPQDVVQEKGNGVTLRRALLVLAMVATVALGVATIYLNELATLQRREFLVLLGDVVIAVAFAGVGAAILWGGARNAMGWVFVTVGVGLALDLFANIYGLLGLLERPGSLPGALWVGWYGSWGWAIPFLLLFTFIFLLFPTGRPPSRRWSPVLWACVFMTGTALVAAALAPGPLEIGEGHPDLLPSNPVGRSIPALETLSSVAEFAFPVLMLACLLSLVFRFRAAGGEERAQIKWFMFAGLSVAAVFLLVEVLPVSDFVADLLFAPVILTLPVAVGIAVMKHRLYDIDILINRTLVYGALTAILGLTYLGAVTAASTFAGDSPVAVAASTLAVAALFQPLRRRVQDFIDHRFYRRKYDAEKTVESFSARLRDEIDLDTLSDELLSVVDQTMQPARVSLWLKQDLA
ncbi:MAG: hypothetical protein M3345_08105 [Actinomycetota bacterium]|nr:hypothetical protein [Actinomycetota bacterium]